MKAGRELRWAVVAALLLLPAAAVPERSLPLDAAGSIRVAQAPYQEPARLNCTLRVEGLFTIACRTANSGESVQVVEQRVAAPSGLLVPDRLPSTFRPQPLNLEAGIEALEPLTRWFEVVRARSLLVQQPGLRNTSPEEFRRDAELTLASADGRLVARFLLSQAWPSSVQWSSEDRVRFQLVANEVVLAPR